jgi:hypothetical protein
LTDFAARAREARRTAGLDAETIEILDRCAAAGAKPLVLKGIALARTLYRPDERRGYFDVDLLAASEDLPTVGRVLADLGYRNINELSGVDDIGDACHAEMWSRLVPDFGNLMIDLHWRLDGCEARPCVIWRALNSRHMLIDVLGHPVRTLDRPGLALHLALHAAHDGPSDLKTMGDLKRGIERWPFEVWHAATQLAVELQAVEWFAAGVRLVPDGRLLARRLGLPVDEAAHEKMALRAMRPGGTFHLRAFSEAPGFRQRLQVLRRALLPKQAWIVWHYPWATTSRGRLVAAYGAHILHVPLMAARAWRFSRRERLTATGRGL